MNRVLSRQKIDPRLKICKSWPYQSALQWKAKNLTIYCRKIISILLKKPLFVNAWFLRTEPSYSNENLSFKWELQLSIHCHFCPCCLLYCCHPFLPSFLWVNKMEDQRRPQILKSGVQRGCRALSNKIRNYFWIKIRYFC